jgi:hypothetical protein
MRGGPLNLEPAQRSRPVRIFKPHYWPASAGFFLARARYPAPLRGDGSTIWSILAPWSTRARPCTSPLPTLACGQPLRGPGLAHRLPATFALRA